MLGIIHRDGLGVPRNFEKAFVYFEAGIGASRAYEGSVIKLERSAWLEFSSEAEVNLNKMQLQGIVHDDRYPDSEQHCSLAILNSPIWEAYHQCGTIRAARVKQYRQDNPQESPDVIAEGKTSGCQLGVAWLKTVAERGDWEWDMMGQADAAWKRGEKVTAVVRWWIAAEMGYEKAQNNVAFLLDHSM